MKEAYPLYLAGEKVVTSDLLEVRNPYDRSIVQTVCRADAAILEQAISKGKAVEPVLRRMPLYEREAALNAIAAGIERKGDALAKSIVLESGKPIRYASGELARAVRTFKEAAVECLKLDGRQFRLDHTPAGAGKEGIERHVPVGLVAGITPFNFPLNLVAHKVAPAIAAGCPIIIKPSSSTPVTALILADIIDDSPLPKGSFSVLPMKSATAAPLIDDRRIALLSFTGSPAVGWKMKEKAVHKRIALELGGNAGVIVAEDADLEHAVSRSMIGAFAYSGQVCIHAQRFFVHSSLFNAFCDEMVKRTTRLMAGDPLVPETEISTLIDEDNAGRVEQWIAEAQTAGARLLCGGVRKGLFVSPTILTGTNRTMKVNGCEVFGPVITIESYDDFNTAIEQVNDTDFGLQAGVFTNRQDEIDRAFAGIETGGVIINDIPTFRVDHMPYGGVKNSGFGREGVAYAMREMCELRLLVKPMAL